MTVSAIERPTRGSLAKEMPATEKLLTVEEVALWLDVTPAWVRAHASGNRNPKLPSLKVGMYRRFRRQAIQDFIEELTRLAGTIR